MTYYRLSYNGANEDELLLEVGDAKINQSVGLVL